MTPEYRVVAEGLRFPEGPLELPNGDILITEIEAGRLTKIRQDGSKAVSYTHLTLPTILRV